MYGTFQVKSTTRLVLDMVYMQDMKVENGKLARMELKVVLGLIEVKKMFRMKFCRVINNSNKKLCS